MSRDALVVGINQYYSMGSLNTPAADAEAIAQYLEKYGNFKVVHRLPLIIQEEQFTVDAEVEPEKLVTAAKLEQALSQLFNPQGTNIPETALFFFAGHGHRKNIGGILEGYLATSETNPNRRDWGVSLKWLRALLQKSPIKQQVVWLDCCYSGELLNFDDADPGDRGAGYGRCFIAASREYEAAYESASSQHGVLTEVLLQKLGADRMVDNYALTDFIQQNLKQSVQQPLTHNSGSRILLTQQPVEVETAKLSGECPYKGLRFFDEADAKYFYGRDDLTDELIEKVRLGNFLAVLGVSGSGKSSVVRAGLLHHLKLGKKLGESRQWRICEPFTPNEKEQSPFDNLARVLVPADLPDATWLKEFDSVKYLLQKGAAGFKQWLDKIDAPRVVLVIDQFEEFFTRCDLSERQQFFECVLGCLLPESQVCKKLCLVITMRADFLGKCAEQDYAGLTRYIDAHQVTVRPMSETELEAAISEPAKQVGLDIEAELITAMLKEVEGPASLPLLEYTLTELWEHRHLNCLTVAEYMRLGGVQGTLQKSADRAYAALTAVEQSVTQWIFLALTQLGEGTEDTRKQVLKTDLVTAQHSAGLIDQVLDKLATARLVVVDALGSRGDKQPLVTVIDVAHEALIRHWGKLRRWLSDNRSALIKKREIETAAKDWEVHEKSKDYLLQGPKLGMAEDYVNNDADKVPLSNLAQEFVRKSIKYRRIRRYSLISVVTAVILVLAGSAFYANEQRVVADIQRVNAELQASALSSENLFASDKQFDALIEAIRAGTKLQKSLQQQVKIKADIQNQVKFALLDTVYGVRERNRLEGHKGQIYDVEFSPDGTLIASASTDGTVKLWNRDGSLNNTLFDNSEMGIIGIEFGKDEKTNEFVIASVVQGKPAFNAGIQAQDIITQIDGESTENINLNEVALRIGGLVGTEVILTVLRNGRELEFRVKRMRIHFKVFGISFSPDSQIIAASHGNTVKLWKCDGTLLNTLKGHNALVIGVSFSPNGKMIASASYDKTVKIWNFEDGQLLKNLPHEGKVWPVKFSPNGKMLVSATLDGTVYLWDVDGNLHQTWKGCRDIGCLAITEYQPIAWDVTFNLNSDTVLAPSYYGVVKRWDVKNGEELSPLTNNLPKSESLSDIGRFETVTLSPDGQVIAAVYAPGNAATEVILWDINGRIISKISNLDYGSTNAISFSPNGKTLATAGINGVIKLWNLEITKQNNLKVTKRAKEPVISYNNFTRRPQIVVNNNGLMTFRDGKIYGQEQDVVRIAYSPDGKIIATAHRNSDYTYTIKLQKHDGTLVQVLGRHGGFVTSVDFSHDGKRIISCSADDTIKLWKNDGTLVKTFQNAHSGTVQDAVFSPDGNLIVSTGGDNTIKFWTLDGSLLKILDGYDETFWTLSFSPDGKMLAALSGTELMKFFRWNLDLDYLLARGCDWVRGYLKNNPNVSETDSQLCNGIEPPSKRRMGKS